MVIWGILGGILPVVVARCDVETLQCNVSTQQRRNNGQFNHAHYARGKIPKYLIRPMHHFPQRERQTD
jgi:hypothetical protein